MPTNLFFDFYKNRPEQNLVEDLINESIRMLGFNCYYLPNTNDAARDLLFGDDPLKKFENAYPMECYLSNSVDPGMNNEFFSKFGLEIKNSVRIMIPRRAFARRSPQDLYSRPREGDLVFIPFLSGQGELYEIKFVNDTTDFFTLGRKQPYYWEIELELFKYSHEEINTGIEEIDEPNRIEAYAIEYQLTTGSGNYQITEIAYQGPDLANSICYGTVQDWNYPNKTVKLTNISGTFSNTAIIIGATSNARYSITSYDPILYPQQENGWDNKIIEDESDSFIITSENNPFGIL